MRAAQYLDQLLDGASVVWKRLDEVGEFQRGKRFVKEDMTDCGVPCIHYGEMYTHYGVWAREAKAFLDEELAARLRIARPRDVVIVAAGETIEDIGNGTAWLGADDVVIHDACFSFRSPLDAKYVSYFLRTSTFKAQIKRNISSGKISSINAEGLGRARIPIPWPDDPEKSLAIQREIVRILDTFTELTDALTYELNQRKKQYNHYRDELLNFNDDEVEWKTLGEVCTRISSGKNKHKSDVGAYPVYGSTGVIGKTNKNVFSKEHILVARVGANAGRVNIGEGEYDVSDNTLILYLQNDDMLKYLYYILVNLNLNRFARGAGQPLLTAGQLKEIKVPLPPPSEQARIVAILDKFDILTTSLTEGLPREIELREKQYAYYRDLLLSFPKPDAEAV